MKANTLSTIPLGRQGENLARQILFDVSGWESEYGPGSVELIAQRPGDETPYPVVTTRDGDSVVWSVTAADTLYPGDSGRCELRYYVGETLAKSRIWGTYVARAMGTPSETTPPEPEKGWVDKVLEAGTSAKEAADRAEAAIVNAPKIQNGTWWTFDQDTQVYVDTGVEAQGPQGENGKDAKESFVITFSASVSGSSITYSCDKTYADILAAYNDGQPLMALIPVDSSTEKVHTSTYRFVNGFPNRVDFYAEIRGEDLDVKQAILLCAFVMESGPTRVIETDMQPGIETLGIVKGVRGELAGYRYTSAEPNVDYMPPVPITKDDNGKFMRVVNGAWAAESIANAEGRTF